MDYGSIMSYLGSIIFLLGYVAQIRRILILKSAHDIAWGMLGLLAFGTIMYLGFFDIKGYVILALITSLCLVSIVIIGMLKVLFKPNDRGVDIG